MPKLRQTTPTWKWDRGDERRKVVEGAGDDSNRFLRHCARYFALSPRTYPRGVFKFRSIEEAQRQRDRPDRDRPIVPEQSRT